MLKTKDLEIYLTSLIKLSMGEYDVTANYLEILDETCVESHHVHNNCYEIYQCLSGEQHLVIEDSIHTLLPGTLAILRPGTLHNTKYEPNVPKRYAVFVFDIPTVNTSRKKGTYNEDHFLPQALKYLEDHSHCVVQDQFNSIDALARIDAELRSPALGIRYMVHALYQEYLINCLRNLNPECPVKDIRSNKNLAIEFTKYMHSNYQNNFSIQDIADAFYVSPRHINRIFEDYFGNSFKRTLNLFRLDYAKNYLVNTNNSVEQVASMVGFSSPKMLYQLFKEIEGCTVNEWRSAHPTAENSSACT